MGVIVPMAGQIVDRMAAGAAGDITPERINQARSLGVSAPRARPIVRAAGQSALGDASAAAATAATPAQGLDLGWRSAAITAPRRRTYFHPIEGLEAGLKFMDFLYRARPFGLNLPVLAVF